MWIREHRQFIEYIFKYPIHAMHYKKGLRRFTFTKNKQKQQTSKHPTPPPKKKNILRATPKGEYNFTWLDKV